MRAPSTGVSVGDIAGVVVGDLDLDRDCDLDLLVGTPWQHTWVEVNGAVYAILGPRL